MDVPFAQAELYITKITASHFKALNTKIANQNVLETILIAMLNENTAVSNENLRNCCGGIRTAPVQLVGFIWPLGAELHQKLV